MSSRSNGSWRRDLSGDPRRRDTALSDLRETLLRGLRRAFAGRPRVDEAFLQDSAQTALIRILERLPQYEGRSRFTTWAMAIAMRVASTELRRGHWKHVPLDAVASDVDRTLLATRGADPDPSTLYDRREVIESLRDAIRSELTERQRTALLAELRGMPLAEIADRLGCKRNAVYKLTHDARVRLRRGLTAAGAPLPGR